MRGQHCHQPANHSSPEDGHGVAEDDEAVVEQELVGAALAVVRDHVRRVVQEVPDGEADEDMAGVGEGPDQIVPHLWSLKNRVVSQVWRLSEHELADLVETYRCPEPGY